MAVTDNMMLQESCRPIKTHGLHLSGHCQRRTGYSGILAFYAWWSFGISLVLAVMTITLAILTMQELTLPQRLWVHRSVFGRPNHNYYNSEPFGGDKPRSLPNDPAAADEWKDYQRRALNEEAQALGMLVTGITLQVDVVRIVTGNIGMAPDLHPKKTCPSVFITISIPDKINGRISIKAEKSSENIIQEEPQEFLFDKENDIFYSYDDTGKRKVDLNIEKK